MTPVPAAAVRNTKNAAELNKLHPQMSDAFGGAFLYPVISFYYTNED